MGAGPGRRGVGPAARGREPGASHTAYGYAESHCDPARHFVERISKTCLASRNDPPLGFTLPPFRNRRCGYVTVFGLRTAYNNVNWYCRKIRDWQTRQDLTVFVDDRRKGTIRAGSYIQTLSCP